MASDNQDIESPAPVSPAVSTVGVGSLLRETRLRLGHDLPSVAAALRIRQPYLEAIEDARYHDLPGTAYAVGFVRGYSEFLGLDGAEIVRRFKQETGEAGRTELLFPAATSEGSLPSGGLLLGAVVVAALAYGGWYWFHARQSSVVESVPALPDRLVALMHKPVGGSTEGTPASPPAPISNGSGQTTATSASPAEASKPVEAVSPPSPSVATEQLTEVVLPPNEGEGVTSSAASSVSSSPVAPSPSANPVSAPSASVTVPIAAPSVPNATTSVPSSATATAPVEAVTPVVVPNADAAAKAAAKAAKIEAAKAAKAAKADAAAKAVAEKAAAAEKAKPMGDAPTPVEAVKPVESTKPADAPKPVEVAPAAAPAPVSASAGSSRVSLRADDDCWVEIRDANGALVNSHLMHKGEVYTPPARPGLQLTVGNAGAISLLVDGKSSGALGRPGMVRRDVSLDPDRQSGSAE